mmetsp:Transcript_25227/g.74530  ORF Transcript_25227/g.74530 Transcript_25227/m.74530 type:complete len:412 (-) Transcript_25227:1846-3081(-)
MPHLRRLLLACCPYCAGPRTDQPPAVDATAAYVEKLTAANTALPQPPLPPSREAQVLGLDSGDVGAAKLPRSAPVPKLGGVSDVRGEGQQPWRRKLAAYAALASAASRSAETRRQTVVFDLDDDAPLRSPPSAMQMLRGGGGRGGSTAGGSSADALQLVGDDACSDDDDDDAPDASMRPAPVSLEHVPPELLTDLLDAFGTAEAASAALHRFGDGAAPAPPSLFMSRNSAMMKVSLARTPPAVRPAQGLGSNTSSLMTAQLSPRGYVERAVPPNRQHQFSARLMKGYEKSMSRRASLTVGNSGERIAFQVGSCAATCHSAGTLCCLSDGISTLCRPIQPSLQPSGANALDRMQQVLDIYSVGSDYLMEQVVVRMRLRSAKQVDMPLGEMEAVMRRLGMSSNINGNGVTPAS